MKTQLDSRTTQVSFDQELKPVEEVSLKAGRAAETITGGSHLTQTIQKTQSFLLNQQNLEGYWLGELEADASVSAGYIPLMYFMIGQVDSLRQAKVINQVTSQQNPDGSWSAYYHGPGDINVSIQVYFALKLAGTPAGEPLMQRARDFIISRGGIRQANLITKIWLALFGQYEWRGVPSVPPEIIFLPTWFYFNIYEFASWSRATIMALSIVLTTKPVCATPESVNLAELYLEPEGQRVYALGRIEKLLSWKSFFLLADHCLKLWEKLPYKPGRKRALHRVEEWIVEHQESDGSWGGILLPWIYSLFALKSLGYTSEHQVIKRGLTGLEGFIVEDEEKLLLQPAVSPVWDTAWTTIALSESGLPADHPAIIKAARWLMGKEICHKGDWRIKNPETEPGGWAFEFENNWYPDLDDSAVVPRALLRAQLSEEEELDKTKAINRALGWVLDMQSKDGGWAAFDRDNDKTALAHIPFADFISPLDPTCSDVTAHAIEFLKELDIQGTPLQGTLHRALAYLRCTQEADGSWYGRWGVNYLYGASLALTALAAAGEDHQQAYIQRTVAWLNGRQNEDGGWGESCQTYADPSQRGRGVSTASQTAWTLIGLIAAGQTSNQAVKEGIDYIIKTQQADGAWYEPYFTGTGFPKVFYLKYDLYRVYYPLIALARYQEAIRR
ncbi:squalene--hopene cyclase [Chloroflexota bacterium]